MIILVALALLLNLFPQIQDYSLIVAVSIFSAAIEIYGFVRDRAAKAEDKASNNQVDSSPGSHTVDMRGATGSINEAKGTINQHFGNNITQIAKQPEKLLIPQISPPKSGFVGRIEDINEILSGFEHGAVIAGLRGMGGVGKTALALVLAEKLASRYPDGQILVDMKGTDKKPLTMAEAMAQVVRAYDPDFKMPPNDGELAGSYFSILHGKMALLLLDNAASREQVEPLLPPVGSAVLITSRNKFALPGLKEKDLDVLPLQDSKKLLWEITKRIGEHASELAKLCGCLPLALRNAAYALKEKPNIGVADYMKRLGDARKRLELVEASFTSSYDLLTPELQRLWSLLSVFPADFDLAGAAAVWEEEQIPVEDALGELVKWSLVDFLPFATGEGGRYRLHDLARVFADSGLNENYREQVRERHACHYMTVLSEANELYKIGNDKIFAGLELFDIEQTNIRVGQAWAAERAKANDNAKRMCSAYPRKGFYILGLRQNPRDQIYWLEPALNAAKQLGDRNAEGAHLGRIGRAYAHLDEYLKAIDYCEQALVIAKEVGDRTVEGWALDNMGSAHRKLGNTQKAIDYCKQHLQIAREIGDTRGEGVALGNIGQAYFAVGNISEAINYYKYHLKIVKSDGNKRGERDAIGNLGNAYASLRDFKRAFNYYEEARAISEEMRDYRGLGDVLGNMGKSYFNLGEYDKAFDYCEQALRASRTIGDRQREAQALFTLGKVSSDRGQGEMAHQFGQKALAIFEQIESPHAETVRKTLAKWNG